MSAMNGLTNALHQTQQNDTTGPRIGTISSYEPGSGVKVKIQPEGRETNWIQLDCVGVGNGWGVQVGPQLGDEVTVNFESSDSNQGRVVARHANSLNVPMPVPSGEIWMVHQSGSLLKFKNDGTVTLHAATSMTYDAPAHHFTGGPISMDHTLTVTDSTGVVVTGGDVKADTISLKLHRTSSVQAGSGTSGVPVP